MTQNQSNERAPVGAGRELRPGAAPNIIVPPPTTVVRSAGDLRTALASAAPGTAIQLADGLYAGSFTLNRSGTEEDPIWVYGSRGAVIDGGGRTGYVVHLDHCAGIRLVGITVRNGQKGVMADGIRNCTIANLWISDIGDEAIHLRSHSTDNLVAGNRIRGTGKRVPKFGEGIYIGSAVGNWRKITGRGKPDRCDRNRIEANDIGGTTAEAIDIKEGTTGTIVSGNVMHADRLSAADSWIDVKGNSCKVRDNTGLPGGALIDGIQVHVVIRGWGENNEIRGNHLTVDGPGHGVYIHRPGKGNIVGCDNEVAGAVMGLSNVPCSSS